MSRSRIGGLFATTVAAALLLLPSVGCGDLAAVDRAMMVTPTAQRTPTLTPEPIPVELAATFLIDTTTSANRFASDAQALFARRVDAWPEPGRGGLEIYLNVISSTSYDAASTLLAGILQGLLEPPVRRQTISRPATPDQTACQSNAFGRAKCEAELAERYNAALAEALADEQAAEDEFRIAEAAFDDVLESRRAEATALADQLTAIDLPVENRGSDINGALLRASEQLRTSGAPAKLLVAWSDLEPYGPQQPGALDLTGIDVLVVHDCAQGVDCSAQRADLTARFAASGAGSVGWLEPSTARLADLFEGVR